MCWRACGHPLCRIGAAARSVCACIIQQSECIIQQTMFKKRNTSKKVATIDDILVDIDIHPQQTATHPPARQSAQPEQREEIIKQDDGDMDPIDKADEQVINAFIKQQSSKMSKPNSNLFDIDNQAGTIPKYQQLMHSNGNTHKYDYAMTDSEKLKEEERKEIEDCFAEFIRTQQQQQEIDRQAQLQGTGRELNDHSPEQQQYNPFTHANTPQQQNQPEHMQQQEHWQQPAPMNQEVVIEDDSGEQVAVVEDYGQLSSHDGSNSQNYEDGYENQIIKKTLTRYNYEQISKQLSHSHQQQRKHKLIKELGKVSYSNVQRRIAKDLIAKKDRKKQLNNQIAYIHNKIQTRHKEIKDKTTAKAMLEADIDQTRRMLQLLYYFGSELNQIDQKQLIRLTQEEDWRQKIDKLRINIRRNKQKFDQEHKKQEADQQQQKERSEGDVEEIPKHRISQGWAGWDDEMDEQANDHHQNYDADDDQCIQIDDD